MISENVYIALVHHPVYNKSGDIVTTAVTNLDLHDIARVAKTYAVGGYFVVNPMAAQRELAGKILRHWLDGFGATYNPNRGEALRVISVVADLEDAASEVEARHGVRPKLVATAAREKPGAVGYGWIRDSISSGGPHILLFGTGWGLSDDFLKGCDHVLEPVKGLNGYNHLPVRAAVAIILDRLLGERA